MNPSENFPNGKLSRSLKGAYSLLEEGGMDQSKVHTSLCVRTLRCPWTKDHVSVHQTRLMLWKTFWVSKHSCTGCLQPNILNLMFVLLWSWTPKLIYYSAGGAPEEGYLWLEHGGLSLCWRLRLSRSRTHSQRRGGGDFQLWPSRAPSRPENPLCNTSRHSIGKSPLAISLIVEHAIYSVITTKRVSTC